MESTDGDEDARIDAERASDEDAELQREPPESATNVARAYIPSIAPSVPKGTATILLVCITWVMLYSILGDILLPNVNDNIIIPGGAVFSLIFIWVAAHVGATVAKFVNVPPLLGMLLSGLLLRNVPGGLVEALPNEWSSATRAERVVVVGRAAAASPSAIDVAGTVDAVVEGSASSTTGNRSSCTSILLPAVGRLGSLRPVLMRSVSIPHICSLSNTGIFVRFGVVRASAFFDLDG